MTPELWPFAARQDEQDRFVAALAPTPAAATEEGSSNVILIEALGGYGKSTLLKRFGAIARGEIKHALLPKPRFRVVEVDWEKQRDRRPELSIAFGPSLLPVLLTLHGELLEGARRGSKVDTKFTRSFQAFSDLAMRAPALKEAAERTAAERAEAASNREQRLNAVAALGTTVTALSPAGPGAASVSPLFKLLRPRRSKSGLDDAVDDVFRFDEALVRSFADGLRLLSKEEPVVVLLDTHEVITGVGPWLRQVARRSGGRVLWVFAGRLQGDGPSDESSETAAFGREVPEGFLRIFSLTKFGDDTTRRLLTENVTQSLPPELLVRAAEVTRGIPLAVRLVARALDHGGDPEEVLGPLTKAGTSSQVVRELARRYLVHVRKDPALSDDLPLLYGLALLHGDRSDPTVLQALWSRSEPIDPLLDQLAQRHDFVQSETQRMHQEIEDTLREYLLASTRRTEVLEANESARAALISRMRKRETEFMLSDSRSHPDLVALVWHSFWVDEDVGFRTLAEAFVPALLFDPEVARELLQIASFFHGGFTEGHESMLRGYASMLTFGTFVDRWLMRRAEAPGLRSSISHLGRARENARPEDRERAEEALIATVTGSSVLGSSAQTRNALVTVLMAATAPDPIAWLDSLEEARDLWPTDAGHASAFSRAATSLRARLLESGAPTDVLRRAAVIDEGFEEAPGTRRVLVHLASLFLTQGEESTASRILDRVNVGEGGNGANLASYADLLHAAGHRAAADAMYQQAVDVSPDDALVLRRYARVLWSEYRLKLSIEMHERAREIEPESSSLLADYAFVLHRVGKDDEAVAALEQAVAAGLDDPDRLGNLGILLEDLDRKDEAREIFERAVAANPEHENNLIAYALLLLRTGHREEADEMFERALAVEPTHPASLGNLASYLEETNRPTEAEEMFLRALDVDPRHPFILTDYAAFLAGNKDERFAPTAHKALEAIDEANGLKATVHFCLWACGPIQSKKIHREATKELLSAGIGVGWGTWTAGLRIVEVAAEAGHPEIEDLKDAMEGADGPSAA